MADEHALTISEVQPQLPELAQRLLYTLERRWYDGFDARQAIMDKTRVGGNVQTESRFLQIHRLIQEPNAQPLQKLLHMQNVLSSFRHASHSLALAVHGAGSRVGLYVGIRQLAERETIQTLDYVEVLRQALLGNFPGLELSDQPIPARTCEDDILDPIIEGKYLACITGVPSLKQDASGSFVQGLDRLIDSLRGQNYTLLILAEPIPEATVAQSMQRCRVLIEEIHRLVRRSIATSDSTSKGESAATSAGATIGGVLSMLFGVTFTKSWTASISKQFGLTETLESIDKTAEFCEQTLEHYLARLQQGRNQGLWTVGVYIGSNDLYTSLQAQGLIRGLFSGHETVFEPLRVVNLFGAPREVIASLASLRNPALDPEIKLHPLGTEFQSLGTPLTTEELSILTSLPQREVPGLKSKLVVDFNLNPPVSAGFEIGDLLYRGMRLPTRLKISPKSLNRHTFITGLTGSGKTNTCLALLTHAYQDQHLNFLVVDPAKTEYRFLMDSPDLKDDLIIFTVGDEQAAPFRLNPFEPVGNFPLLSHIDLIKSVFNAAFPMYASMPYILEEALLAIYTERGWDLTDSTNRFLPDRSADCSDYLPRMSDLYTKIDEVVASKQYGPQLTQDISAALKARIGSLTNGTKGLVLDARRSIPMADLLTRPVVLELRKIADDDEKAFIMALVFVLLYEACQQRPISNRLAHVTLVEEAHRLLRNVPLALSADSANSRGKTVEMFTDMMAEMRAYGEGFIIVDQMPGKLVPDVIKGSNLKVVHRLLAQDDRQAVGNAMGMTVAQIDYLPRLNVGEAVIHSEELEEACLVKIDSVEDKLGHLSSDKSVPSSDVENTLKRRAQTFYQEHSSILWRYPGCIQCDAPCTYRPDQKTEIVETLSSHADRFVTALLVGSSQGISSLRETIQTGLVARLKQQYGDGYAAGHMTCARTVLGVQTAYTLFRAYPRARNWEAIVQLQRGLAEIWENWPPAVVRLNELRRLIGMKIATAPAQPKTGCVGCRTRCWFGQRFQLKDHPGVQQLTARLKGPTPLMEEEVITLPQQTFGVDIDPRFQSAAAYCLLVQCANDESLLSRFRAGLSKPA